MIFLIQFGINKHLIFNFCWSLKNILVLIYSNLHLKASDYLYKQNKISIKCPFKITMMLMIYCCCCYCYYYYHCISTKMSSYSYPEIWNKLSLTSILSISPYSEELTMELSMCNCPKSATSISFDFELQGITIWGAFTDTFNPIFAPCFWMY